MECLLPGATAEQSVNNLYTWLDTIMVSLGLGGSFTYSSSHQRIPGIYHHLSKQELVTFKNTLDRVIRQWQIECLTNNISAGYMVEIFGAACGKGSMLASAVSIGPFIC